MNYSKMWQKVENNKRRRDESEIDQEGKDATEKGGGAVSEKDNC